jgi:hypothetical protein
MMNSRMVGAGRPANRTSCNKDGSPLVALAAFFFIGRAAAPARDQRLYRYASRLGPHA